MDLPIRPRQPEDGWSENTGVAPFADDTRIDLVFDREFDKPLIGTSAGSWNFEHGFVTHWRLYDPCRPK